VTHHFHTQFREAKAAGGGLEEESDCHDHISSKITVKETELATSDWEETLPNWLFPALILSIDTIPAAFSTLSKADPQPKSDGLLALVQRNRSWHDNATASEKV
jgi:hypothetical protein